MRRGRGEEPGDEDVAELAALADGSLPPERRAQLKARVAESPELAAALAEQQRAVALMRTAGAQVQAPPALRARIEAERTARGGASARAGARRRGTAAGTEREDSTAGARRRDPLARRFRVLVPAGAVALTAALVLITFIGSGSNGEQFLTALAPTGVVPGARGDATLTKTTSGWRIELDAAGLPRLDKGRFYEAWLRNRAGVLVPIGTFNEGSNVTLWAGVSPKEYTTLTITRERANGAQASSGQRVLVGTVDTSSG